MLHKLVYNNALIEGLFGIVVTIDIQSVILLKNTLKRYLFLFFKNYFDAFSNKKHFKKQPQQHSQRYLKCVISNNTLVSLNYGISYTCINVDVSQ